MKLFFFLITSFLFLTLTLPALPQSHKLPTKVYSAEKSVPLLSSNYQFLTTVASSSSEFSYTSPQTLVGIKEETASASGEITTAAAADYCVDVPVILYHHVQPMQLAQLLGHPQLTLDSQIFEDQMKYLVQNGYQAISAEQLVTALFSKQSLPEKSVVITLDDGYDDNYTYAFMVAKKYKLLMNFMIPTDLMGKPGYMNWDHIKEMAINPYADIYNHTTSHASLDLLSQDEVRYEVVNAMTALQDNIGYNHHILTYPYGAYTDDVIATAANVGIKAAFTTESGETHCLSNSMKLPRYHIGNAPMSEYGL